MAEYATKVYGNKAVCSIILTTDLVPPCERRFDIIDAKRGNDGQEYPFVGCANRSFPQADRGFIYKEIP